MTGMQDGMEKLINSASCRVEYLNMVPSRGTESCVAAVSSGRGTQRWMTDVSAKMIHGKPGGDEGLGHGCFWLEFCL